MKFRYLIPTFMAVVAAMFVSCSDDNDPTYLDEVQVSSSYVAIPQDGGSTTITVTATGDWAFESQQWIAGKDTTVAAAPKWLNVNTISGAAGQTDITFSAESTIDGRSCELLLNCGGKTQRINVIQGLSTVSNATCAEVIAGPDSKTYRVTGVCTSIANTNYGNWYLEDATGKIYIYGTVDKSGKYNWSSFGIEVGDEVTVEGPKTTYNGTVELVDVQVISVNKSLIKIESIDPEDATLPIEGGDFTVTLSNKGQGVYVDIPENAASWLSIKSISGNTVKFHAAANEGGDRGTTIVFKTTDGRKEYSCEQALSQKGAIVAATVADFVAAEVSTTQYRLNGIISKLYYYKDAVAGFYISDYSGEVLVYKAGGFTGTEAKPGDVVTVVGQRGDYKGTAQLVSGTLESVDHVVTVCETISEFLSKPESKDVYYMVTGTIKNIANASYGNMTIEDENEEVYVYGCYPGWGATGDNRKGLVDKLGLKAGDTVTIIGQRSSHNGQDQLGNGIYFSHEAAE